MEQYQRNRRDKPKKEERHDRARGIAIYLRLSRMDGDVGDGKDESNSIENQRKLLLDYIDEHPELEGTVYCYTDDGESGGDFLRPGYTRMMDDAKKSLFDTIIVKDFSRLGRDYIGVADYVERIFPLLGIRFISVNNHFDSGSATGASMDIGLAFENLVNTFYLQDSIKKKRTANEVRWKQGKATVSFVPFGYYWDKSRKGEWIIDPISSKYVRHIFDMALEGKTTGQIARDLNKEAMMTPGVYNTWRMESRTQEEQTRLWPVLGSKAPDEEQLWTAEMVRAVLKRYEYTGALVMDKYKVTKSPETGKKTRTRRPESERIITENAHEAIVTAEEFEKAQGAIRSQKRTHSPVRREYPLKGKVRCGNCRRMLIYEPRKYHAGFLCCLSTRSSAGMSGCNMEHYSLEAINAKVLNAIERVVSVAQVLEVKLESRNLEEELDIPDAKHIETQIRVMKEERIRQYEGYADGMITRQEYLAKKKKIDRKIEKLEAELVETREMLAEEQRILEEIKKIGRADDAEDDGTEEQSEKPKPHVLTRALVEAFIDTVYVYDMEHIEIVFTCEDVMKAAMDRVYGDGGKVDGADADETDASETELPAL